MLKRFLRNLRQQPKSTRESVAFALAGVFTFMVFSVWALNIPDRLALIQDRDETASEEAGPGFGSFFSSLRDQMAGVVGSLDATDIPVDNAGEAATATQSADNQIDVQALLDNFAAQSGTSSDTKVDTVANSETSGREVRIITTQSASSATSIQQ